MPSLFDEIDAGMQSVVDAVFGEGIRVEPQAGDGNYSAGADPARPVRENVRAIVGRAPIAKGVDYSGTTRNGPPVATSPAEVWLDRAAYAALGYAITRGDRIVLTGEAGAPCFTVASALPGDNGDVRIILA